MISEQARRGVSLIFTKAATNNLTVAPSDQIQIERLDGHGLVMPSEKHIVVLSIASYVFRLLTIFHVDIDAATEAYFTRSGAAGAFGDCFGEIGNRCCGAMNRELGRYFQHLGMSTPAMLDAQCLPFLAELKPTYLDHHRIRINDTLTLHATLCLRAYAPIDFNVDHQAAPETTGELELF